MKRDQELAQQLILTAEIYGKTLSQLGARLLVKDLEAYPREKVIEALARCRRELKTFPTVADIASRIDDGRPGVEEAWGMLPRDEETSVVWTEEMSAAWGSASRLMQEGDLIGARMAFKEKYSRLISEAKAQSKPVKWLVSLGHDSHLRDAALKEALSLNRISHTEARLLGYEPPAEKQESKKLTSLVSTSLKSLEKQISHD